MRLRKEEIESFTVISEDRVLKQVIISQDIVTYYNKEKDYIKHFHLESLSGEEVYQTEDPDILKLANGTEFRRRER